MALLLVLPDILIHLFTTKSALLEWQIDFILIFPVVHISQICNLRTLL